MSEIPENGLEQDLLERQRLYRDIFLRSKDALESKLKTFSTDEEKIYFLQNEVSKDILGKINSYKKALKNYECARCGTCCRVACSEFSHPELLEKATEGDSFAKSFTAVFVPYENKTAVEQEFGEYVELLKKSGLYEETYFYHCPKVIKDENGCHACSDYENRPIVCRDFPNNPLVILPPKCSYNAWKDKFEIEALFLNAMVELVGFYMKKLP